MEIDGGACGNLVNKELLFAAHSCIFAGNNILFICYLCIHCGKNSISLSTRLCICQHYTISIILGRVATHKIRNVYDITFLKFPIQINLNVLAFTIKFKTVIFSVFLFYSSTV